MGKYWRLLAHYDAETQAYSACAGALQTSPYTPDESAKLIGLRVIMGGEAATSLIRGVQFRLTCTTFKPNTIHAFGEDTGIQTALHPQPPTYDYEVNQPVVAGVPITIEAKNDVATAVTVAVFLLGCFES